MDKLTFTDIKQILLELADRKSANFELTEFIDSDNLDIYSFKNCIPAQFHILLDRIGNFKVVEDSDSDGSSSGYNENPVWRVLYFNDHDIYIKFSGWNGSYSGYQFDSMKEVKPITKTITTYE